MGPIDALIHLLNLLALPVGSALIVSLLARRLGGPSLRATPLKQLLLWSAPAAALVVLAGLAIGRDGRMLTYGAMVVAIALALQRAPRFAPKQPGPPRPR